MGERQERTLSGKGSTGSLFGSCFPGGYPLNPTYIAGIEMCQGETKYGVLQNLLLLLQNALKYVMIHMKKFYNSRRNNLGICS